MKLKKVLKYKGKMELVTGLSIKGNSNELNIGGADAEVIKNPVTGRPYVPGSSLKGKMRSRMELFKGVSGSAPCRCGSNSCNICKVFGAHMNPKAESAPTRIIVRDCELTEESINVIDALDLDKGSFIELKAENIIKRDKGTAETPRFIERVPAGLSFNTEIILQIFDDDNEDELKKFVEDALKAVEDSYLGGSGSRGYGQVKFEGSWE